MKIVVTIDLELGSEFQKKFACDSLEIVLKSWKEYLEQSHKKNNLTVLVEYIDK